MAVLTKDSVVSLDASSGMFAPQIPDLLAGEAIAAGDCCYIKTADGKLYRSNGTAAAEAAEFVGLAARAAAVGQPVTVFGLGARFHYAAAGTLGPGDKYFVSATPGALDTVATIGGTVAVAQAINDTDIRVIHAGT
jgi:hypothetical protein